MRCAVIDTSTMKVTNVIIADASVDLALPGTMLVNLDDSSPVDARWSWSTDKGFFPSDPDLIAQMDADAAAEAVIQQQTPFLLGGS